MYILMVRYFASSECHQQTGILFADFVQSAERKGEWKGGKGQKSDGKKHMQK